LRPNCFDIFSFISLPPSPKPGLASKRIATEIIAAARLEKNTSETRTRFKEDCDSDGSVDIRLSNPCLRNQDSLQRGLRLYSTICCTTCSSRSLRNQDSLQRGLRLTPQLPPPRGGQYKGSETRTRFKEDCDRCALRERDRPSFFSETRTRFKEDCDLLAIISFSSFLL